MFKELFTKENLVNLGMIALGTALGVVFVAPLITSLYSKIKAKTA